MERRTYYRRLNPNTTLGKNNETDKPQTRRKDTIRLEITKKKKKRQKNTYE